MQSKPTCVAIVQAEPGMERRPAVPLTVQRAVFARQHGKCNQCGQALGRVYDVDHVIPRSVLPRDDAASLQVLCVECHAIKTRTIEPKLIAAHKQPGYRVCWAGCKRIVCADTYDSTLLACPPCATRLQEEQAARYNVASLFERFRYTPAHGTHDSHDSQAAPMVSPYFTEPAHQT